MSGDVGKEEKTKNKVEMESRSEADDIVLVEKKHN